MQIESSVLYISVTVIFYALRAAAYLMTVPRDQYTTKDIANLALIVFMMFWGWYTCLQILSN